MEPRFLSKFYKLDQSASSRLVAEREKVAVLGEGKRIASIDQFRGFAIFGMILVNYLGHFEFMPETLKHPAME